MNKRQIEKRISLIPETSVNNVYIEDSEYLFLLKKTEKIILATYILTDFIPDTEPLKKSLKDNSHDLLDSVCDLIYKRGNRDFFIQKTKTLFIKMLTQFGLAEISGFISKMNSDVIKNEIQNLLRIIDDLERELKDEQAPSLKQNYFDVDIKNKRHYNKDEKLIKKEGAIKLEEYKGHAIKDTISDRDNEVLNIVKERKEVSIKDISNLIFDCSEKTIQRTLNKLISDKKVKKTGERRWARYSIS